jgi:hypothetical protein
MRSTTLGRTGKGSTARAPGDLSPGLRRKDTGVRSPSNAFGPLMSLNMLI